MRQRHRQPLVFRRVALTFQQSSVVRGQARLAVPFTDALSQAQPLRQRKIAGVRRRKQRQIAGLNGIGRRLTGGSGLRQRGIRRNLGQFGQQIDLVR